MRRSSVVLLLVSATLLCVVPAMAAGQPEIQSLNQTVRDALRRHATPPVDALSRRALLLRTAIRENPAAARALLLRPEEMATLAQSSAAARSLLEVPSSYTAEHATVFDSADWTSAYYVYRLSTPEGNVSAYQDANEGAQPSCRTRMLVEGYRIGDTMLVTNSSAAEKKVVVY